MNLSRSLPLAAILAVLAPAAHAFTAENGMRVAPEGGGFHVAAFAGKSLTDYFCAASDYARRELGAPVSARLWRVSEPPRRQGQGISFSLSSEGAASSSGLAVFGGKDASLSVAHAQSFCRLVKIILPDD